jgi:hypothetical protein
MSFLKNWLLGLILAIPLLCSPWIVETLQAKGRLNAINIDRAVGQENTNSFSS